MMKKLIGLTGFLILLQATPSLAADAITFSGFGTFGLSYADTRIIPGDLNRAVTQDGRIESRVTFDNDTRFGLQVTGVISPRVSTSAQFLARGRGRGDVSENFDIIANWAYLNYKFADALNLRVGRLKFPNYLTSDYVEVGYAYPWVRPPMEVYNSIPVTTFDGVDLLIRQNFGDLSLLVQPYFGYSRDKVIVPQEVLGLIAALFPPGASPVNPGDVVYFDYDADRIQGLKIALSSDIFSVYAHYFKVNVDFPPPIPGVPLSIRGADVRYSSAGATLDWANIVLFTEYFENKVEDELAVVYPQQKGYYATAGYRIGKFLPHVTVAKLDDNDSPSGIVLPGIPVPLNSIPLIQKSITLGLRYEIATGAALKIEAQQIKPEDSNAINALTGLPVPGRGLLIADPRTGADPTDKVRIYSLAVDIVF